MVALNVKALGSEFAEFASDEVVGQILVRLASVFGEPFGRDRKLMKAMAEEWVRALNDMPRVTVQRAVNEWIDAETKWPKPADIRRKANLHLDKRVEQVAETDGLHPRRIKPTEDMAVFSFVKSQLRENAEWAKFLNGIHPTAEHCFFAHARFGKYAHELENLTTFEADYIREHWGEKFEEIFKHRLSLKADRLAA